MSAPACPGGPPIAFTTLGPRQLEEYGRECLESWLGRWPGPAYVYAESGVEVPGFHVRGMPELLPLLPRLLPSSPGWRYDVRRFLPKATVLCEAIRAFPGRLVFWVDADVVMLQRIPEAFLSGLLHDWPFCFLGRAGGASETGFLGFDTSFAAPAEITARMAEVYASGEVYGLEGWADTWVFDRAREEVQGNDLSPRGRDFEHVWCTSVLAEYMDHLKGARKAKGFSPEHPSRRKA